MIQLSEIFAKYKFSMRITLLEIEIAKVEAEIKITLPADYKSFLVEYEKFQGLVNCEYLALWGAEDILSLNQSYSITESLTNTFGIGDNGAGEFIAIEFQEYNSYKLILCPFIGLDEKRNHITIGTSFFDMLSRLDQGIQWFNS